jgi:REP element-mobilizing transposase RayT
LADSLPPRGKDERVTDTTAKRLDDALDRGLGKCWLRDSEVAAIVEDALLHFDGERYALLAWCIMPNHVHVMLETRQGHPLTSVIRSWKTCSSRLANLHLRRSGEFWAPDYFDRFVRDERHYRAAIAYIEENPVKAGLVHRAAEWRWSSAWPR